jgi:HAD superfamily hydrolase (TIGR01509 family)
MKFKNTIEKFRKINDYPNEPFKAVLFDMDGVLYDSMPAHAESWQKMMNAHGFDFSLHDAYLNEGRTGFDTIKYFCIKHNLTLSDQEIDKLYEEKTVNFISNPDPLPMKFSQQVLQKVVAHGLKPMIVTGSGQATLLDNINKNFPGIFSKDNMVTAFDVTKGKPDPEPYLMALNKGNLKPWEAFVVENAPLGVTAAHDAGIFVVAVNTGPLEDLYLWNTGANIVLHSMEELFDELDELIQSNC